ncbi:hypothetical protein NDU88_002132 [Pleurodeles waltl]|uniref:Uncharacterized protein n=1 Tax=Pleurodeles waltl TaxID=8319 RepID=A0AAV7V9Q4_PLEWA|nr:hypothetical protein NDU88_002132 [Pleurodeles waltl]
MRPWSSAQFGPGPWPSSNNTFEMEARAQGRAWPRSLTSMKNVQLKPGPWPGSTNTFVIASGDLDLVRPRSQPPLQIHS